MEDRVLAQPKTQKGALGELMPLQEARNLVNERGGNCCCSGGSSTSTDQVRPIATHQMRPQIRSNRDMILLLRGVRAQDPRQLDDAVRFEIFIRRERTLE